MRRVAVLGDVHGNSVALAAVLDDRRQEEVDLVVWTGDISWGWEPEATLQLVRSLEVPFRCIRGNAERALLELRDGKIEVPTEPEVWMVRQHTEADITFVELFEIGFAIDIEELGPTHFCHGSPRSDEELLTAGTPSERMLAATSEIDAKVLVTAPTHAQYDRQVGALRAANPGSVGMPYEGVPGAY